MLSRRHLRIKVMQALYSYYQAPSNDLLLAEKQLFSGIDKIYDLYLYLLLLPVELADWSRRAGFIEKHFPTQEDKLVTRLSESVLILQMMENPAFKKALQQRKVSWKGQEDLLEKMFLDIKKTDLFKKYILNEERSFAADKAFIVELFNKQLAPSADLQGFIEERNIYWNNSEQWMSTVAAKTLESIREGSMEDFLSPLYREESDKTFVRELFMQTIIYGQDYENSIAEKTKNWEVERIAMMDVILMKMALAELVHFNQIPVKVTINEYLEIAKDYSTPKSNSFINGIIDKLSAEYKMSGKIKKQGAGLVE